MIRALLSPGALASVSAEQSSQVLTEVEQSYNAKDRRKVDNPAYRDAMTKLFSGSSAANRSLWHPSIGLAD
jgi:hypothetical protein